MRITSFLAQKRRLLGQGCQYPNVGPVSDMERPKHERKFQVGALPFRIQRAEAL